MKTVVILLCIYLVSLVSTLPIISKPLENNPDHLVWEALLTIDTHRSDDKTRKIPKSIFITPNLNESKGNCPPDHKLGPDGRCYKTLKIDPLSILKTQIESLLKKNNTATTEYDEDYDYSEYGESTESMSANGQYTVPLSLGFASDNRIPQQQQHHQQTTFPNLNRVVKDDSHIAPGLHISNEKENQPFLVSTTGIDLGPEDVSIEEKPERSASVATASNIVPSTTTAVNPVETTSIDVSSISSTSESITTTASTSSTPNTDATTTTTATATPTTLTTVKDVQQSQSTVASTTTDEIVTDESTTTSSSTQLYSSNSNVSSTESSETTPTMISSSVKSLAIDEDISTTSEKIENVTVNTTSSEVTTNSDGTTENIVSPSTENLKLVVNTQTEANESTPKAEVTDVTQTEAATVQSSTSSMFESVEAQSELPKLLPALSHISGELKRKPTITPSTSEIPTTEQKNDHIDDMAKIKSLKLIDSSVTEPNETSNEKVFIVQAQNHTDQDDSSLSKSDSYEVVEAIFIPSRSELVEEIDPTVGKSLNNSVGEPKYRLENASANLDDELSEAEIAPIIDTGKNGRENIELVGESDETQRIQHDDERKNLNDRLAEELLFQGTSLETAKSDEFPTNETIELADSPTKERFETNNSKIDDLEELLSGGGVGVEMNFGSEMTTEEPIDYDTKEIKFPTESVNTEDTSEIPRIVEYEGELPDKEAIPFNKPAAVTEQETFQPTILQPPPSIYSTFLNRLKYRPPVVDLHGHGQQSDTVPYTHHPFNIAPTIHNANFNRRRPAQTVTTSHPTFTTTSDNDRSFESTGNIEQQSPVRGKALQIGINCYLRSLVNKQQFIICDNA